MHCAFVPPVIVCRAKGTICDMRDDAKGVVVFFGCAVTDANTTDDALVGCSVLSCFPPTCPKACPEGLKRGGIEGFDVIDAKCGLMMARPSPSTKCPGSTCSR